MKAHLITRIALIALALPLMIGAFPSGAPAQSVPFQGRGSEVVSDKLLEEWAYTIGLQAYVWGYPLVSNYNRFSRAAVIPQMAVVNRTIPAVPVNRIGFVSNHVLPEERFIAAPNRDTLYGAGWLDLTKEAVVLRIPPIKNRYWIVEMCDFYTDVFASPGSRLDSRPGKYLITGPRWKGTIPEGIVDIYRAPTNRVFLLARILMKGQSDRPAALSVINRITLAPVSQLEGIPEVIEYDKLPNINWPNVTPDWVPDATFWATLRKAIDSTEGRQGEEALVASFKKVMADAEESAAVKRGLDRAVKTGKQLVTRMSDWDRLGTPLKHGWTTCYTGGRFGTDYLTRAAAAYSFIYYNLLEDAAYYLQVLDATGTRLNGANRYVIHFDKENRPPIAPGAFWSLTVYDGDYFLADNPFGRHNLGTVTEGLRYNADGSLDIYLQNDEPREKEQESNWIPVPKGPFGLTLRVYVPGPTVVNRTYNPPPVARVKP